MVGDEFLLVDFLSLIFLARSPSPKKYRKICAADGSISVEVDRWWCVWTPRCQQHSHVRTINEMVEIEITWAGDDRIFTFIQLTIAIDIRSQSCSNLACVQQSVGIAIRTRTGDVLQCRLDPRPLWACIWIDCDRPFKSQDDRSIWQDSAVEQVHRNSNQSLAHSALSSRTCVSQKNMRIDRVDLDGECLEWTIEISSRAHVKLNIS